MGVQSTCGRTREHSKRGSSFWVSVDTCVKGGQRGGRNTVGRRREGWEEQSRKGEGGVGGAEWEGGGRGGELVRPLTSTHESHV